jgi:prepilin-type N-terminal cleavage/methylation domain-containing protein
MRNKMKKGFTLVELLVVISIMVLLFSIGYANYRDFQRRQHLEGAVRMIKADLRLAQEMALAGRKPQYPSGNVCEISTLGGYSFIRLSQNSYRIDAICSGVVTVKGPETLASGVEMASFSGGNTIFFRVLGRGIDAASDITITLTFPEAGIAPRQIVVTPAGEIR